MPLTLTLSGPLAAYGDGPRLQHRLTGPAPTRSAVIGLLRCALGIARDQASPELDQLSVTVTQATSTGRESDFHTVRDAVTYDGKTGRNIITTRHYLVESSATVTIDGPGLEALATALARPRWQLYLGRRCCVPDRPVLAHSGTGSAEA